LLSPLVQWVGRRLRGPAASAIPTGTP
jgi:hypothetical protein